MSGSSLISRLSLLATLLGASAVLDNAQFTTFAFLLGVTTAVQVLLDPNATAAYLVAMWPSADEPQRQAAFGAALRLQGVAAGVVALTPLVITGAVAPGPINLALAGGLGIAAAAESLGRLARVVWQLHDDFVTFALVDLAFAGSRLTAVLALLIFRDPLGYAGVAAALAFAALAVPLLARRALGGDLVSPAVLGIRALIGQTWPYSASSFCSSLYSQGPILVLGFFGTIRDAALYSIATRLTQPTELVPAAIASVHLPALSRAAELDRWSIFRAQTLLAAGVGVIVAITIAASSPLVLPLFDVRFAEGGILLVFLAFVLPVKFVNYQLVSLAVATGRIRARLRRAAVVAGVSLVGVVALADVSIEAVAIVTLASELLSLALLGSLARREADTGS